MMATMITIPDSLATQAPEFWRLVDVSRHILLHCHPRADQDSVGSVVALAAVLRGLGKEVTAIAGDDPLAAYLQWLPGAEKILEQNYGATDLADIDLFIILDSGAPDRISALGPVVFPPPLKTIVIDHHATTAPFGELNILAPEAAATAEILFNLFAWRKIELPRESAVGLFIGLYGDTGSFRYPNVTPETLEIAAELRRHLPDWGLLVSQLENQESLERLRARGLGLLAAEAWGEGRVMISALSCNYLAEQKVAVVPGIASNIAAELKSIASCRLALCLLEEKPGLIKLSARSRDGERWDVNQLVGRLGGGGHKAAAGAVLADVTMAEATERLRELVAELYPDLVDG